MKKKRIRVLQLIDILKGGGAEEWLKELTRLLDKDRFEVKVCYLLESPQETYVRELSQTGAKVLYIGINKGISKSILSSTTLKNNSFFRALARHSYILYCLTKLRSLYRIIVRERIEIIHSHLHYSFLLASLMGRELKIPVVCQVPQMRSQTAKTAPWSFSAYKFFNHYVSSFYTNISEDELVRYGRVPREKIRFIKGVVDLETINPVEKRFNPLVDEFNLENAFPILLSMGRFVPEKGHKHSLDVAWKLKQRFPGAKLFILGEGWEMEKFNSMVKERDLQNTIIMPGYRRDLHYFYSIADIYLRTCLLEGGSLANYQAMAYGNPIVGFETKAPTETITHGVNGFLAPLGDTEKMTDHVLNLAGNKDLREAISIESRDYAYRNLDIRDTIRSIESEYENLCNGKRKPYSKRKK